MQSIWMAIVPERTATLILAKDAARATVLKASLPRPARHPRAIPSLLEAIALWAGQPVRAVLAADDLSTLFGSRNWRDELTLCLRSPLFDISVVPRHRPHRPAEGPAGVDDFDELEALLNVEAHDDHT